MLDISEIKIQRKVNKNDHWYKRYVVHYKGQQYPAISASSRIIFRIDAYAIKYDPAGAESFRNEIELYNKLTQKERKHFTKIYGHDFRKKIMVVRYLDLLPGEKGRTQKNKGVIQQIIDKYDLWDVSTTCLNNWGICRKTKRPIIYDWEFHNA